MSTAVRHSNIKVHDEDNVIYIPAPSSACVQVLNSQLVCGGETGGEDLNPCGPGNTDIHVPQLYDIQPWCSCNAIQYRHVMLIPCAFLAFLKCGSHTKKISKHVQCTCTQMYAQASHASVTGHWT